MPDKKNKEAKTLNPLDEYYLLPLMLCLALASSICLLYLLSELAKSPFEVQQYYQWDTTTYSLYRDQLIIYIVATVTILSLQSWSIRLKKRWLYLLLIGANLLLFVYLPGLLNFKSPV